ncbi:MAG TPA: cardiolipin synthase [Ktedonobacteraceae bacterium]|nr:cardiolipin synthase [Ktedonobacteraceae bacterium]
MSNWSVVTTIIVIVGWLIPFVMLFIVPVNRKPSSATAWLMLAFLLPYIGVLIFLLLGSPRLSRRRRAEQHTMNDFISKTVMEASSRPELSDLVDPTIPARYDPFVKLNTNLGYLPALAGNDVELLPVYQRIFERIAADIDAAQKFVHMEYYTVSRDDETEGVFAAMERAVNRGVKVRILMDHLGSREYPHFKELWRRLTDAGIEHHVMLPLRLPGATYTRPDLRNHRKIVVIDGQTGYTGSQNLIQRNYFRKDDIYYDELVARVRGPVVAELEAAFLTDWYSETGVLLDRQSAPETAIELMACGDMLCQVLPSGSAFQNENNLKLFTSLIHAARHTLVITNPYFVPDDALTTAITSAAQRGVRVTLMNSEASDQFFVSHAERSYYEELLNAGVKIYQYRAPILLHAKHITVDNDIAVIGSSNLDMRSFQLNLEVTLICYDTRVVAALRQVEANNLLKARSVNPAEWEARALREKFFENIARLAAALQ